MQPPENLTNDNFGDIVLIIANGYLRKVASSKKYPSNRLDIDDKFKHESSPCNKFK